MTNTTDLIVLPDVDTQLTFDTERWDVGDLFDPANPSRLTAPANGTYQVECRASWATNGSGWRNLSVRVNAGLMVAVTTQEGSYEHYTENGVTTQYRLSAGDYVTCHASQYPAASVTIAANPPGLASTQEFAMTRVAP